MISNVCKMLGNSDRLHMVRLVLGNENKFIGSKFQDDLPPMSKSTIYHHLCLLVDNKVFEVSPCSADTRERVYSVNLDVLHEAAKEIQNLMEGSLWQDKEK